MKKIKDWFSFFAPRFLVLALILGFLVRTALVLHPVTVVDWGFVDWVKIVVLGFLNDVLFCSVGLVPAFIAYTFLTDGKYRKPWSYVLWSVLVLLTLYVVLFNDITDEYGGPMPWIANGILGILSVCFTIKLFIPQVRKTWRTVAVFLIMLLYVAAAVTIAICEVVFWSEFGVRFNFIAVDYLVYTNEVIGNIVESYPIVWMVLGMAVISSGIVWIMVRGNDVREAGIGSRRRWGITAASMVLSCTVSFFFLHYGYRHFGSKNFFATQIQENGCWDFLEAFVSNELDYRQFYPMLPEEEALALQRSLSAQGDDGLQHVDAALPVIKKNIVLITVESLSADFLTRYGNTSGITPALDTLIERSLVFDRLYAAGNRTVRGLEALTLSLPPSAGESLVKRPVQDGFHSLAKVLEPYGYHSYFIYGGDSYFDNMGAFFSACGYDVVDKKSFDKDAIVFSNIWGTADEDSYREALGRFDASYEAGEPFFGHIMTISNHRPYTYPEGRIEYDGNPMSRKAAVCYTDWAIGDFIAKASLKPWFAETVFVILADHCASSAGKTSLPVECYHIPAFIYAPGFVEPQAVEKLCSQIDVMPTLLSMLHFSYDAPFYGRDILSPDFKERAFMATYQDLGYYADGILTVMSPVCRVQQFSVTQDDGWNYSEKLLDSTVEGTLTEAKAFYQAANLKYQNPSE